MDKSLYPESSADIARKRRELAPKPLEAFKAFSAAVFADGALHGSHLGRRRNAGRRGLCAFGAGAGYDAARA